MSAEHRRPALDEVDRDDEPISRGGTNDPPAEAGQGAGRDFHFLAGNELVLLHLKARGEQAPALPEVIRQARLVRHVEVTYDPARGEGRKEPVAIAPPAQPRPSTAASNAEIKTIVPTDSSNVLVP